MHHSSGIHRDDVVSGKHAFLNGYWEQRGPRSFVVTDMKTGNL